MKTYIDVIDEVVKFYGEDIDRRSIDPRNGKCLYNGPEGRRCAFAMFCKNPHSLVEGDILLNLNPRHLEESLQGLLKDDVSHLCMVDFWKDIQELHDICIYWYPGKGLSSDGEDHVKLLKEKYKWKTIYYRVLSVGVRILMLQEGYCLSARAALAMYAERCNHQKRKQLTLGIQGLRSI